MPRSDEELLASAQDGDRAALEELLARHQHRVFRFGMKMCGEEEDAKDVLQETLLAAARGIREFRGASSVSTWLYSIARSFCIRRHRTSKFAPAEVTSLDHAAPEARAVPDARRGPEEDAAGAQVRAALERAIASLDPMYREVLLLRDVEGLPAAEVAGVLGLTVEAVKSRLHRARVAVRGQLAPVLGTPEAPALDQGRSCPDIVALLSQHLEGEISGTVCSRIEEHVQRCDRCRSRCESLRATLTLCSQAGDDVPPHVEQSVRAALRRYLESAA